MTKKRKSLPLATKKLVLHESGYRCANPVCRTILTLDIHHLEYVSEVVDNSAENLLPLCPNCHTLHHSGHIPRESLRAWKMLLITLNEGFDRRSIDLLLSLSSVGLVVLSGDGLLVCAPLIAAGLIKVVNQPFVHEGVLDVRYKVELSDKGRSLIEAWKQGNQTAMVSAGGSA